MIKLFSIIGLKKNYFVGAVLFLIIQVLGTMFLPTMMAQIIDNGVAKSDLQYIYTHCGYMLLLALGSGAGALLSTVFASFFASNVGKSIRSLIFKRVQDYSLSDMQDIGIPSLITRSTSDISIVQRTSMALTQMMLPAPIMAILGLILAFRANTYIGFIIVTIVVIFTTIAILIGKKAIPLFLILQKKMDKITHTLREIITGVRIIRAFNKEEYEKDRFDTASQDYCEIAVRINKIFAILIPFLLLIANLGVVCILGFSKSLTIEGQMQIGDIFASIEYLTIVLWGTLLALFVFMEIPRAQSCAIRILEVLEKEPSIKNDGNKIQINEKIETLEFRNVTFQYPGAEEAVLDSISFVAKVGETTAIIGGTGSGKSTIANLIPRFYDIQKGEILINGINIADIPQHILRNYIGFVPQKTFLFQGTIDSNLRFGKENATSEEIIAASRIAQASGFISKLDKAYESYVAQGGSNFSGGQKQRLAIARAIVKRPPIYVFDDSFSALDFKTDSILRQALKDEIKDAIVIIVAQRINTIMNADQIIVLDDGEMVGIGTHEELLENCSVYAQIADSQIKMVEK